MAKRRRRKPKKNTRGTIAVAAVILAIIFLLAFGSDGEFASNIQEIWNSTTANANNAEVNHTAQSLSNLDERSGELILYAIDTGNSDSILIYTPDGYSMLVDAGESDDYRKISGTLQAFGIEKLDVAVATHPDSDHIGSMNDVLKEYDPSSFYLPDYSKNTATFKRMLETANEMQGDVIFAYAPLSFMLGEHVQAQVFSPPEGIALDGANNYSIVLLLTYGETKILLTGDAERQALGIMLDEYGPLLDADVLKVGHHGSYTSTTKDLMDAVTPAIGVITCGKDNDYGHPHSETMELLDAYGVLTLRTDQNGDIALFMDGTSIDYATAA